MLYFQFVNEFTVICPLQDLSLRLAEREGARIVLATDPDADRLAVAEQCDRSVSPGVTVTQLTEHFIHTKLIS